MNSVADLWVRSGRNPERLYQGSTEDIVKELKAWVERRKTHNNVAIEGHWDMFRGIDSIQELSDQSAGIQKGQISGVMDQVYAITATQLANLERNRNLGKEKARETLLAAFFLASLKHRGNRWPPMPHLERTQVDANVCAFLATADSDFDAESELEILKDRTRIAQWEAELRRRDVIRAEEIANDPIPGVNTHPIGLVGARMSQGIANNPTISTRQALVDAAHGVLIPGAVDLVMGGSSTATTSTSSPFGRASRASDATAPTTDNKAVFIADMLGNINLAAGPSSSSATDGGVADQTLLSGTEGKDEACKLSKSKRKRDRAKRAKAARAKEAAENAGNAVINDDGDNDGDAPDLADG